MFCASVETLCKDTTFEKTEAAKTVLFPVYY